MKNLRVKLIGLLVIVTILSASLMAVFPASQFTTTVVTCGEWVKLSDNHYHLDCKGESNTFYQLQNVNVVIPAFWLK